MSEEPTQNLIDKRSFEERVLTRFDAFDARFDSIDGRLEKLESRTYDTKPIWERALQAIMDTGLEVGEIKTRVGVIEEKVDVIESKVDVIGEKVGVIESKVQLLENEVGAMKITIRNELVDIRRDLSHKIRDRLDLVLKFLHEDREDIRDAEARIRQLESKLA